MICPGIDVPQWIFFSEQVPPLLYYSHIPSILVSLLLGFFIFFKTKKTLASKLLLGISLSFFLWAILSLIVWTSNRSDVIIFSWSFFGVLCTLISILSFYFAYVFLVGKDMPLWGKVSMGVLLLPVILLTPTSQNLSVFDSFLCGINDEGFYFTNYYYGIGLVAFFSILVLAWLMYRKRYGESRIQLLLFTFGIELFLLSFFIAGFLASYLVDNGLLSDYSFEQYGLFGMTFFMAFLAYLIVRYKAFDIHLLGTQSLVVSLIFLIGSQFFFVKTRTNFILTAITFILVVMAGFILVRSYKRDQERKEQLQQMSDSLSLSNDKLRKLDAAKSEFISIASHQLRTPLTAIKGYLSLIMEGSYGKVDGVILDVLNKIYISNERLVQLVENLLNISRIESGRMQYRFEPMQIESLLEELYDTFALIAKNKKLRLVLNLPEQSLPVLSLDRQKIQEAISNLIDNAIKYTNEGSVTVSAKDMGTVVTVTIEDTGIGIPSEEIPFLFAKFSRGKDVGRLHANGTGLGLYVVKNIVEAHQGRIWIDSDGAGKGSRFVIEFPKEVSSRE